MRNLLRPEPPPQLSKGAAKWTQAWVAACEAGGKRSFSWHGADKAVRPALSQMTRGQCAFCEGWLNVTSAETIEHFRPKSTFPALAYDWHNLFPCCSLCQQNKLERFDERLLKPDDPNYRCEDWFVFDFRTGRISPRPDLPADRWDRAQETLRLYGLDTPTRGKARLRELAAFESDLVGLVEDYAYLSFIEAGRLPRTVQA